MIRDLKPELGEILDHLNELIQAKVRYTPPPPEEADLWVEGCTDIDCGDGTTIYGKPTWWPKAEVEAWDLLRFRRGWTEIGSA